MWRLLKVFIVALLIFSVVNFFLSNSTPEAQSLASQISFRFDLPPFVSLQSPQFPVGYLLLVSFLLGMILTGLIGGLGTFSRAKEFRERKKRIQELEKEQGELRKSLERKEELLMTRLGSSPSSNTNLPNEPEIE